MNFRVAVVHEEFRHDFGGDVHAPNSGWWMPTGVPVTYDGREGVTNIMGNAGLHRVTHIDGCCTVYAHIDLIQYDMYKDMYRHLTPAVIGAVLARNTGAGIITNYKISEIGLFLSRNVDPRIKTIGEQLDEKAPKLVCTCDIRDLMSDTGHRKTCPERRK